MHAVPRRFSVLVVLTLFAMVIAGCSSPAGSSNEQPTTPPQEVPTAAPIITTAPPAPTLGATSAVTATTPPITAATAVATLGASGGTTATGTLSTTTPIANATTAPLGPANIQLPSGCSNVQIQYWTPFTGPDGPFMRKLVEEFNAANPQVKANFVIQPDYVTKMSTAAASDTLPDLASINEDQVATMAFNHIIRAIPDNLLSQLGVGANDFPKAAWDIGSVNGKQYAIPLSMVELAMYYNQDLMQKANISAPPTNETEFAQAAAAMTSGNDHGFVITTGFPVQQIFQQLLHQFGGTEFNSDTTQATWNSAAGVQALQWMKDAQQKYSQPKLPVDADLNAFKAGQAGMIWNGIWQLPNVTGDSVSFKSGATATPQIGPQPAAWAGASLFTLPMHKNAVDQCKDAASIMLMRYILDHSADWALAGNIPALNAVRHGAQFSSQQPYASIAPEVENPVFLPGGVPGVADAFAPLGDAVSAVMTGSATDIKGTLDNAAQKADQILAQNKQKYGNAP